MITDKNLNYNKLISLCDSAIIRNIEKFTTLRYIKICRYRFSFIALTFKNKTGLINFYLLY